jgi:hypothetical protein
MITLFVEGGAGMLPVLVAGGMAVLAGGAHAAGLDRAKGAAEALRTATFCLAVAGSAIDLRAVGSAAAMAEAAAPVALQGLSESVAPLVLAGLLAGMSALFAAAGDLRRPR